MEKAKKIVNIVVNVLLWIFLVFSVIVTTLVLSSTQNVNGVPTIFGRSVLTIQSGSMEPMFYKGDIIIIKQLEDNTTLKKGDIITFRDKQGDVTFLNTHKIVEEPYSDGGVLYYPTCGINEEYGTTVKDIDYTKVVGLFRAADSSEYQGTRIKGLGKFLDFLRNEKGTGFLILVVIPLLLFFIFEIVNFVLVIQKSKVKKQEPQVSEDEIKRRAIEEYIRMQQEAQKQSSESNEDKKE